jgi:hypothetical protein
VIEHVSASSFQLPASSFQLPASRFPLPADDPVTSDD